jgi:hypothetical protein
MLCLQHLRQRRRIRASGMLGHAERARDRLGNEAAVFDRRKLNESHAVGVTVDEAGADLEGEALLPTPPGPVSVTSRFERMSWRTVATSRDRPTKLVSRMGRLCRRPGALTGAGNSRGGRLAAERNSARSSACSPRLSASRRAVSRYGARRVPRSRSEMPRALISTLAASASCVRPAARRYLRRSSLKPA